MKNPIFQSLAEAARRGESVALGIITGVKGSSPQKVGAKAVFHADRRIQGTLGGGCLEAEAQRLALQAIETGQPAQFDLVLDHDFGWDDGLICGGRVQGLLLPNAQSAGEQFWGALSEPKAARLWGVKSDFTIAPADTGIVTRHSSLDTGDWLYVETVAPPCALWIAGSGHIAQAVAPLALQLDFAVAVFDDRPEFANEKFFPGDIAIKVGNWGDLCNEPFGEAPTFGLIVTRGHQHDALVLETWIHRAFAFLGMIGSARKARMIFEQFIRKKIATAEQLQRVACPVGLKIQAQSVMEIAVSIMAQLVARRTELRLGQPRS